MGEIFSSDGWLVSFLAEDFVWCREQFSLGGMI